MARPRLGESERRTRTIGVRVTEAGETELRERAQAARLSMEAYLRRRALRQRVRIAAELRLGAVWKGRRNGRMRRQGRTGSQYVTVVVLSIGTGSGTWVLEERMEQVREIDGEQAYEKISRAVEKASQPLQPSQYRSRDRPERGGPERGGPERDFGRPVELAGGIVGSYGVPGLIAARGL